MSTDDACQACHTTPFEAIARRCFVRHHTHDLLTCRHPSCTYIYLTLRTEIVSLMSSLFISTLRTKTPQTTFNLLRTMSSTNQSHATNPQTQSAVPESVQKNVPRGVEESLPDSVSPLHTSLKLGRINLQVHNTNPGADAHKSHATGPSMVPEAIQKAAPEGLEKALPEAIHPTNPK